MPPATRVLAFLLVFTALFILTLILAVVAEFSDAKWIKTIISIGDRLGRLTFVAIATTFILVEGVPMLADWARKQWRKEEREKGRVEGQAEERKVWRTWLREMDAWEERKAAAERESRDFIEPRPAPPVEERVGYSC